MRYRARPIEVEVFIWDEDDGTLEKLEGLGLKTGGQYTKYPYSNIVRGLRVNGMEVAKGDYIVRNAAGEFYPHKAGTFELMFEKVE